MRRRRAGEDVGHWECCEVRLPGVFPLFWALTCGGLAALICPLSAECGVSRRGVAKGKMGNGNVVNMGRKKNGAPDPRRPSSGTIQIPQVRGPARPATNAPAPTKKEEKHTNDAVMAGMLRHAAQKSWAETSGSKRAKGLTSQAQMTPTKHQKTGPVQPRPCAPTQPRPQTGAALACNHPARAAISRCRLVDLGLTNKAF